MSRAARKPLRKDAPARRKPAPAPWLALTKACVSSFSSRMSIGAGFDTGCLRWFGCARARGVRNYGSVAAMPRLR